MAEYYRDDDDRPAPHTVVAAVACGTTPVPFLAVYAVLFLVHGSVHPVVPPDITDTTRGEFISGVIAAVLFVLCSVSLIWAISGRRRWPFVAVQLVMLGAALYFLVDGTKGGTFVSYLVVVICLTAVVLILLPMSSTFYGQLDLRRFARSRRRAATGAADDEHTMPAASAAVSDAVPATARVANRPRPGVAARDDQRG